MKPFDPIYEKEYDKNGQLIQQKTVEVNGLNISEDIYESIDHKVGNSTKPTSKTNHFQVIYGRPGENESNNQFNPQELYATDDKQNTGKLNKNLDRFQEL